STFGSGVATARDAIAAAVPPSPTLHDSANPAWEGSFSGLGSTNFSSPSHVPQSGHLPIHCVCTPPHDRQMKCVLALAIANSVPHADGASASIASQREPIHRLRTIDSRQLRGHGFDIFLGRARIEY